MENVSPKTAWKFALLPVVAMAILAMYPQISLWVNKGSEWKGSYAVSNYDEVAYSAYVNALINGKPRRSDPFANTDDTAHESLYSIQFIPAYSVAAPARLFSISASSAFIFLGLLTAIFSVLALFWLIQTVTGNPALSAVGTLVIFCFGTAVAFQGELRYLVEGRILIDFFPFLRRYQPGFAFPIFFIFCVFVWRSFIQTEWKRAVSYAFLSGIAFAVLVFSYFYLWTAAAAWVSCLTVLNVFWNKDDRRRVISSAGIIGVLASLPLIAYFLMLSNQVSTPDSVLLSTNTHAPDFASPPLIIGLMVAVAIGIFAYRGRLVFREPRVLLAISYAVTPVILLNQQVVTGRVLQPVHYEIFIANYLVLIAAVLLFAMLLKAPNASERPRFSKALIYVAALAVVWGSIETSAPTTRNAVYANIRDDTIPAVRLIEQRVASSPPRDRTPVVLATNFVSSDFIPTVSVLRPLWNAHTSTAGGVSIAENKRLFYLYLYYSGFTSRDLEDGLRQNVFEVTAAIFGPDRALPALGQPDKKISVAEISTEVKKYADFAAAFSAADAANPPLDYLIVPTKAEPDFTNLDRWYQRDNGESTGLFKVYGLTPKAVTHP